MTDTNATEAPARGPLDIRAVMASLPHRYPFLLVDKVVSIIPHKSIHAVKAVTMNEQFFQGHFPSRPIMPGVLIIEALAQTAGILVVDNLDLANSGKIVYFMGIDNAKFRSPVEPGVLLDLHVEIERWRGTVGKFAGKAMIEGKVVAEAQFTAMIADPPQD